MPFTQAGQLARPAPIALRDDSIGHIAQNLRESTFGALPVLDRVPAERRMAAADDAPVRVLGLVLERDLINCEPVKVLSDDPKSTFSGEQEAGDKSTLPSKHCTAETIMREDLGFVPAVFSLENALSTLQRYDVPALPVIDGNGSYLGLISHADVLAAMNKNIADGWRHGDAAGRLAHRWPHQRWRAHIGAVSFWHFDGVVFHLQLCCDGARFVLAERVFPHRLDHPICFGSHRHGGELGKLV